MRPALLSPVAVGVAGIGVMWGLAFLFTSVALTGFSLTQVSFLRAAIAAAVVVIIVQVRGGARAWKSLRSVPLPLLVSLGLLNAAIPYGLITLAQQSVPSSTAAVFNATVPILTIVVSVAARREPVPGLSRLVGTAIGFVGIVVMTGFVGSGVSLPVVALLGAALSYALGFVLAADPRVKAASGSAIAGVQMAVGAFTLGIPLLLADPARVAGFSLPALAALLALAVVSTALPAVIYYRLVRIGGPARASLTTYVVPVVGVAAGWIVLGEAPSAQTMAGTATVLVGLFIAQAGSAPWRRKETT